MIACLLGGLSFSKGGNCFVWEIRRERLTKYPHSFSFTPAAKLEFEFEFRMFSRYRILYIIYQPIISSLQILLLVLC